METPYKKKIYCGCTAVCPVLLVALTMQSSAGKAVKRVRVLVAMPMLVLLAMLDIVLVQHVLPQFVTVHIAA